NFSAIYFSRFFSSSNSLLYPKTINQQTQKPLPKKMPPAFFAKPKEAMILQRLKYICCELCR
ncbi:MAG: hypothetical protein MR909_02640, partial [Clostridiales bacterium]|nr:hypothetical protein [Clostridiales bacterium]